MSRTALRILQLGAIAVVLAAATWSPFELDRFAVPKELVLHATALFAGMFAMRRLPSTRLDRLILAFILLGTASALLATNRWLALRALAVSVSAIVIFEVARSLREAGLAQPLIEAIAFAVVLACAVSLLQAYGLRLDVFADDRAPGGTLGNRNSVGHMAAFGLPVVLFAATRAATKRGRMLGAAGTAIVAAALVLTRSRAAWIAAAIVVVIFVISTFVVTERKRLAFLAAIALAGGLIAVALPNTLHWRSRNPYLQSVKNVTKYDAGSGHGRLIQYERSLYLTMWHPLLGAGPGNWPVRYPEHAAKDDPSMSESEPGTTTNPWPSSDWIAFLSERGPAAAILLGLAFLAIALRALRGADRLAGATLIATLAAATVAGLFDAVLLLPAPSLLVWATLGALLPEERSQELETTIEAEPVPPRLFPGGAMVIMLTICALGAAHSIAQAVAMDAYTSGRDLERASHIDPGNYRLQLRLARGGTRRTRCEHARAAHALFPNAASAKAVSRGCE